MRAKLSGRDYQADFTFVPVRSISASAEPVVYIASGSQLKHSAPPSSGVL